MMKTGLAATSLITLRGITAEAERRVWAARRLAPCLLTPKATPLREVLVK